MKLPNGKTFTIEAKNNSAANKYIRQATLNGQIWEKPWFTHEDLLKGGTLELEMSHEPNKAWGASPAAMPPSALDVNSLKI